MGATSSGRPTRPGGIASPYASRLNPSRRLMVSADLDTVSRREGRPASELLRAHLEQRVPARRLGMPDEGARLFAYFASDSAAFVNGAVRSIDGGELAG